MASILDIYKNIVHKSKNISNKKDILPPIIIKKNNLKTMDWTTLKDLDTSLIKSIDFPIDKYYPDEYPKKQIVIHHTVSNGNANGNIQHWLTLPDKVATCIIVDGNGIVNQCFSSKYWAHHLGVKSTFLKDKGFTDYRTRNVELNKASIAIEIDNWGGLILGDGTPKQFGSKTDGTPNMINTISGKYYAAYGNAVDVQVEHFPNGFRGYNYYEKYSDIQLKTVGELLLLFNAKYQISLDYQEDMWDISKNALGGKPGIFTHVSYRTDKSDCSPQENLIEMLKTLKSLS